MSTSNKQSSGEGEDRASAEKSPIFYVNKLSPPVGTSYYEMNPITVFDHKETAWYDLTWRADVYKYVVGARPDDPKFKENGGLIYIIMVHDVVRQWGNSTTDVGCWNREWLTQAHAIVR